MRGHLVDIGGASMVATDGQTHLDLPWQAEEDSRVETEVGEYLRNLAFVERARRWVYLLALAGGGGHL